MAINKTKNKLLQITLSNQDAERLEQIKNDISEMLNIDLNKSQTIAFLIKNYSKTATFSQIANINLYAEKPQKTATKNGINYSAQVRALKDKLSVSFTDLSVIVGIPAPTLKKYASDIQRPKGENEQLLKDALKKYGIK